MTYIDFIEHANAISSKSMTLKLFLKNNNDHYLKLLKDAAFCEIDRKHKGKIKLCERIYLSYHNLPAIPVCKSCDKQLRFVSNVIGYVEHARCIWAKSNENRKLEKRIIDNFISSSLKDKITYLVEIEKNLNVGASKFIKLCVDEIINATPFLSNTATIPERIYCLYYDIKARPICKICNVRHLKFNSFAVGYQNSCSIKCSRQTLGFINGCKATCLEKYGSEHFFSSKAGMEKVKQTLFENYGVTNPANIPAVAAIIEKKCYIKFKTEFINRLKSLNLALMNENDFHFLRSRNEYGVLITHDYDLRCLICGHEFRQNARFHCPKCFPDLEKYRIGEGAVHSFLYNDLGIVCKRNVRSIINPYELDIVAVDYKIAVEYDGLFFHSQLSGGKDKNYHLMKTQSCNKLGYELIHIFEDEWLTNKKAIKTKLRQVFQKERYRPLIKNCEIKFITDTEVKQKFLDKYDVAGNDESSIFIGCFYKNKLLAIMTFSKLTKFKFKLERFTVMNNFYVNYLCNNMLNYFINSFKPKTIIWETDLKWPYQNLFKNLEFHITKQIKPQQWKIIKGGKCGFFRCTSAEFDSTPLNQRDTIYDCGKLLFEKQLNPS